MWSLLFGLTINLGFIFAECVSCQSSPLVVSTQTKHATVVPYNSKSPRVSHCERSCWNQHRVEQRSLLGSDINEKSLKFLMPIETIFSRAVNFGNATQQIRNFCRSVLNCDRCLRHCKESQHRNLWLLSLKTHEIMCRAFIENREVFTCLYENHAVIDYDCASQRLQLDHVVQETDHQNLERKLPQICLMFEHFEHCHFKALRRTCQVDQSAFWPKLQEASTQAMRSFLQMVSSVSVQEFKSPPECVRMPNWADVSKPPAPVTQKADENDENDNHATSNMKTDDRGAGGSAGVDRSPIRIFATLFIGAIIMVSNCF